MKEDEITKLAKKAIKAEASGKYVEGTREINIWSKYGMALTAFHNAATPRAWLDMVSKKEKA